MKNRILYVFFVATALICCFAVSAFAGYDIDKDKILELEKVESLSECFSSGDADDNGTTTASDARLILRASVNLENVDASNFVNADIDGDGRLSAADARYALRLSVGLEQFPEHKIVDIVITPATCSTEGLSVKLCTGCVKLYAVFSTPNTNHVNGLWETVEEANCLKEGKAQLKCLFCKEVIKETPVAKTGHSGDWEYPTGKSCIDPVKKTRTCAVCKAVEETTENPPGAHSFKWIHEIPNTCLEDGLDVYQCTHCGQKGDSVVTKAHGHLYERNVTSVEPTCTEKGIKADECVFCGDRQNESEIPATGHKFDEMHYKVTKEPSCAETGTADVVCVFCAEKREIILDKTEHTVVAGWMTTKAATCTENGIEEGVCRYCGPVTKEIEAKGHTITSWVNIKPATCAEPGIKQGYCSECKESATEETLPLTDHSFNEIDANGKIVIHHLSGVLCKEDGKGYVLCTVCGYKKVGTITKIGSCRAGSTKVITPATCTTDETVISLCMFCKEEMSGTKKVNKNSRLGHDWSDWNITKAATCTEKGAQTRECFRCDITEDQEIPALTHQPGEWIVISEATCTAEGKSSLSCTVCDAVLQTKTIGKIDHIPGEWVLVSEATCAAEGKKTLSCTVCETVIDTEISEKLAHTPGEWVVVSEATCISEGKTTLSCTECNTVLDTKTSAKTAHKPGEWTVITEATCETEGKSELACSVCETVLQTKTSSKTEHIHGKTVIETPATATESGTVAVYCAVCEEKIETRPFTRIRVDSTFNITFSEDCDITSGGAISFTIEDAAENMMIEYSYEIDETIFNETIEELNGVYSFTIPAELPETAVITITVLSW